VLLLWRAWKQYRTVQPAIAVAAPAPVDLNADYVAADQLPEDEWLEMARRLSHEGDLRLALRALYLATLARLAHQDLLVIARGKSNLDYARELSRTGDRQPELRGAFASTVGLFERTWYGTHSANGEMLQTIETNFAGMRRT